MCSYMYMGVGNTYKQMLLFALHAGYFKVHG